MLRYASMMSTVLVAGVALAQQPAVYTFRLDKAERNPASCAAADAALSRPQTVTVGDGVATLKSNGGINDRAKMVKPGIYQARWSLSGVNYDIEVDTTASPATLAVSERNLGCKWSGKAA